MVKKSESTLRKKQRDSCSKKVVVLTGCKVTSEHAWYVVKDGKSYISFETNIRGKKGVRAVLDHLNDQNARLKIVLEYKI